MHDIDRTQAEYYGETEGYMDEIQADGYAGEFEESNFETDEFESDEFETDEMNEYDNAMELNNFEMLNEADEMELATELLEMQDEAELDQFIGKLFRKVSPFVGHFLRSKAGQALGGKLKGFLRNNLGNLTGLAAQGLNAVVPGAGILAAPLARRAGNALGGLFEMELEGLSAEDQEYEVARGLVRVGGEAIKQAANMPPGMAPHVVAHSALQAATRGLPARSKVRWVRMVRQGNRITFIL